MTLTELRRLRFDYRRRNERLIAVTIAADSFAKLKRDIDDKIPLHPRGAFDIGVHPKGIQIEGVRVWEGISILPTYVAIQA